MNDTARKILDNRWLTCFSRAALGCILIIASVSKLQEHATFINDVIDYGMLPEFLARAYGFVLPWVELFIGCCLVLGVFVRFASLLSIPIIFSFIVANFYSLVHTTPDMCGCLGDLVTLSHPVSLVIDLVMMMLAGQIWLNKRSGEFLCLGPLIHRLGNGSGGTLRFLFEKASMVYVVFLALALLAAFSPDISGESTDFKLSVSVDSAIGGSVTISPQSSVYEPGTEVTLTATAEDGYIFDYWSGGLSVSENPVKIIMNEDKAITAHFSLSYSLIISIDPTGGGSVTPDPQGDAYASGTEVTLTATAEDGYVFDHWSGISETTNPATVTMDSDKSVIAYFSRVYSLTISVDPIGEGSVTTSPDSDYYAPDTEVTLTAVPAYGYDFDYWEGVDSADTDTATVIMDSNRTVTAHFTAGDMYSLTVIVDPSYGGNQVSRSPSLAPYEDGDTVTLTANAGADYTFDSWEGVDSADAGTATITMDSNKTVTAHFTATVTYNLNVVVAPTYGGNQVNISPSLGSYNPGIEVTLTAIPAYGYDFDYWEGAATGETTSVNITIDSNKSITAHFTATVTYELKVKVDPYYKGIVEISTLEDLHTTDTILKLYYEPGTPVTLTVTPKSDTYTFLGWENWGVSIGDDNPITIIMDAEKEITALIDCG